MSKWELKLVVSRLSDGKSLEPGTRCDINATKYFATMWRCRSFSASCG